MRIRRAMAVVLVAALASCGGGGGDDDADEAASGSASDASEESSTTTTEAPSDVEGSTTTAAPSGATTTTASPAGDGTAPAPPEDDPFIGPGTYRYRQTGSVTAGAQTMESPPEGTLVVDPPSGDRQTLRRYLDPAGEPTDIVVEVTGGVARLVETVSRQGGQEVRCTFDPPMEGVDEVGESARGQGTCEGADLEVDIETRATGTTTVQLDGRTFDALVTETITTTSGQFVSETRSLDHVLVDLGIPAHTEMQISGSFGAVTFQGEGTADLLSTVPA